MKLLKKTLIARRCLWHYPGCQDRGIAPRLKIKLNDLEGGTGTKSS